MKPRPQPEMMRLIAKKLETKGYVGVKEVESIAARLRLPSSRVFGFASQFEELPLHPYRTRARVCIGPACADSGAWAIFEELKQRSPADVEVIAEPGILRRHLPPAVCIEIPKKGAWLVEGLAPDEMDGLLAALDKGEPSSYRALGQASPPEVEVAPQYGRTPWSSGAELPGSWGPDLIEWISGHRKEALQKVEGSGAFGESWISGGVSPAMMVCDTVGAEPENSTGFAACLINPDAVVAGAAIAAAACGAKKLVFYLPWNEMEAAEAMDEVADGLLSGVGVRYSILYGPAHVPCSLDIGRAAVAQGMMLWRAASLYAWNGTSRGDPPIAVYTSEQVWRLPWLMDESTELAEEQSGSRLICLAGFEESPLMLEVARGATVADILALAGRQAGKGAYKGIHAGGFPSDSVDLAGAGSGAITASGEMVALDPLVCIPRWALYLAWYAERGCCGGCTPGRTVPAAAAHLIQDVLRGEAEEEDLRKLESLLASAGALALCPRLGETLRPIISCMRDFKDEFEAHASQGTCKAGSCAPAVKAAT